MKTVFNISLIIFISVGLLMVIGQMVGLLFMNSEVVLKSKDLLEFPAYLFSSIAAILGFILLYRKDKTA
ncbi:hypothetical protein QWT69_16275 [Sporosarcina oncorhynchi]|uniref:Uncharacterized protein n=1 Tax=Sporosarcina oncorhynchi TaxID=3056444 RepID=A0ABZ0L461_9BACL|nr:hypothetical protein [Sporosarcina sp. T2O-4]WOV87384.1 hypothetical protein QWT69_16275 [Sporosarcina sp. T2O-4]